jgi:hypothetical protein
MPLHIPNACKAPSNSTYSDCRPPPLKDCATLQLARKLDDTPLTFSTRQQTVQQRIWDTLEPGHFVQIDRCTLGSQLRQVFYFDSHASLLNPCCVTCGRQCTVREYAKLAADLVHKKFSSPGDKVPASMEVWHT